MTTTLDRRSFIACGCLAACPFLVRDSSASPDAPRPVFDETMGYCCATCTPDACAFLSTDPEVKRKKARELSEKLGRELKPEDVHCSRCRVPDDVAYASIRGCKIRQCVIARGHVSCAHCPELGAEACRLDPRMRERADEVRAALA